jgi:hypothetical protein
MSDKEAVLELMKSLPSDVSLREIIQEIEFFTAVKEGFAEIDQGKGILIEEVEKRLTYVRTTPFIDRY